MHIANYFRTRAVSKSFRPFLQGSNTVLDIGAGSCHIAKALAGQGFAVTAIDVVDHSTTDFPLILYDGKKLPYADKSFDVGLLIFVLHHAPDVGGLIREARRVCKRLIVVEDMPGNVLERALWKRWDYLLNHAHHKDIAVAHEARTADEWQHLFAGRGLTIVATKRFRSFFSTLLTYPHRVFDLLPASDKRTQTPPK